jgi:hypothetical protein
MKIGLTCLVLSVALVVFASQAGAGKRELEASEDLWLPSMRLRLKKLKEDRISKPCSQETPALSSAEASKAEAPPKKVARRKKVAPTCACPPRTMVYKVFASQAGAGKRELEAFKDCWVLSMRLSLKKLYEDWISSLCSQETPEVKDFSAEKAPLVELNVPPFSSHGDPVVHFNENVWVEPTYCANPENFTSDNSMIYYNSAGDSESCVIQGHTFLPGGAIASSPENFTREEMCIDSEDFQLGYDLRFIEALVSDEDFMTYFLTSEKSHSVVSTESNAR